jgi:hypothetical protein
MIVGVGAQADGIYEAAVHELKEELGPSVAPGRLLVADCGPARATRTEGSCSSTTADA